MANPHRFRDKKVKGGGHEKGQRTKKRNIQFQKEFAVNRINNGKNSLLNRDVRECEEAMTELHRTRRPRE
jgi:hypothetical protein